LLLTNTLAPSAEVLPALALLSHHVHILPAEPAALIDSPSADAVLVDARRELAAGRSLCRMLRTTGLSVPLLAILTEGGLAGLTAEWGVDDVILETAGPAEVEARLRLAMGSLALSVKTTRPPVRSPRVTWSSTRPATRHGSAGDCSI